MPPHIPTAGQQPQLPHWNELHPKEHTEDAEHFCLSAKYNILMFKASLPGLVDLMICFIIRDMLSLRSSLVLARHHPSRSVHSDSVPSFRWMIFCRLKSSKRKEMLIFCTQV